VFYHNYILVGLESKLGGNLIISKINGPNSPSKDALRDE
jgi:hypothetical protein